MKNIAVVLAGGTGSRIGGNLPKQFLKLNGKEILCYSIEAFDRHAAIDEIYVVSHADHIDYTSKLAAECCKHKPYKVLVGGKERYHSSLSAINECKEEANLIFHDAARPFVTQKNISDIVNALKKYMAADTAVKATDTVLKVNSDGFILEIPKRDFLYNSQTPQAFRKSVIAKAYEKALKDTEFTTTDDCGVVKRYLPEVDIYVVEGDRCNMKLTFPEDIKILEIWREHEPNI